MEINPQAVFAKLQARIAQLELDNAVMSSVLDATQARLAALEEEHAECGKPKVSQNGHDVLLHAPGEKVP